VQRAASYYVPAVATGQRFYSGVGAFNWCYLSSPSQVLRGSQFPLESRGLISLVCLPHGCVPFGYAHHAYIYLLEITPLAFFTHHSVNKPVLIVL
jgi:hypothetical protein